MSNSARCHPRTADLLFRFRLQRAPATVNRPCGSTSCDSIDEAEQTASPRKGPPPPSPQKAVRVEDEDDLSDEEATCEFEKVTDEGIVHLRIYVGLLPALQPPAEYNRIADRELFFLEDFLARVQHFPNIEHRLGRQGVLRYSWRSQDFIRDHDGRWPNETAVWAVTDCFPLTVSP
jgi:hypothetical protein